MNPYFKNLKKALLFGILNSGGGRSYYTWYENNDQEGSITTEFYYGLDTGTNVPKKIDNKPVSRLGCTTYSSNEYVTTVTVQNSVTVIE